MVQSCGNCPVFMGKKANSANIGAREVDLSSDGGDDGELTSLGLVEISEILAIQDDLFP